MRTRCGAAGSSEGVVCPAAPSVMGRSYASTRRRTPARRTGSCGGIRVATGQCTRGAVGLPGAGAGGRGFSRVGLGGVLPRPLVDVVAELREPAPDADQA